MLPKKWLDRSERKIKFGWLLHNHIGISPDKLLSWRLINLNFVQFFNDKGIIPLKLLLLKSNASIPSKEPNEIGIFPWKWLFAKLRIFNPSKCIQQLGSSPNNWLLERSRRSKFPLAIAHRDWIGSENIFLERSKCDALNKNLGILPSRLLELKSFKGKMENFPENFGT